jgi:hypothetical protein
VFSPKHKVSSSGDDDSGSSDEEEHLEGVHSLCLTLCTDACGAISDQLLGQSMPYQTMPLLARAFRDVEGAQAAPTSGRKGENRLPLPSFGSW